MSYPRNRICPCEGGQRPVRRSRRASAAAISGPVSRWIPSEKEAENVELAVEDEDEEPERPAPKKKTVRVAKKTEQTA